MRNRLRGTLLSAAAGVAVAAAPTGAAFAQEYPTVTPGQEPAPGRYSVPAGAMPMGGPPPGAMPFAGPGELSEALPPGMLPPANAGGTGGPGRVPVGPGGSPLLPDSLRPYPRISPYDHKFDQFSNEGGLWMRTANNTPRKYYGGASYLDGKFKKANRTSIGARRTLTEVIDELFVTNQGFGFNDPTLGVNTLDGFIVTLPWVKEALLPTFSPDLQDGNVEFYGLAIVQEDFDPDAAGVDFLANRPRLVPFYDVAVDVDTTTGILDTTTIGEAADGVTLDAFGYEPIDGGVFSSEKDLALLPGYDSLIGTQYDEADNPGVRVRFGFEEADGGGFEWSADWLIEDDDVYARGDVEEAQRYFVDLQNQNAFTNPVALRADQRFRPTALGVIVVEANPALNTPFGVDGGPDVFQTNLQTLGGGTVLTGEGLDPTLAAFTYDLLYEHQFTSEQAGTEFSYVFTPLLRKGRFRLRPSFGLRANYIKESYDFYGLDSGAIYTQTNTGAYNTPGTFGSFVGPGGATIFDPRDAVNPGAGGNFTATFPYQSELNNDVRTFLFGPQAGLHADVEGKFLSLRGHVKSGVAVLREEISVSGQGFNLNQNVTGDLRPFEDREKHGRFSPFVDANVRAELNVFPYIPVLNKAKILKNSRFTGGFSVTSFWEISRPLDTVVWREANAGNPFVNDDSDDRSQLYFTNWDLGVTWRW